MVVLLPFVNVCMTDKLINAYKMHIPTLPIKDLGLKR